MNPIYLILSLSLFALTACTFTIPQFNGLRASSGGILASAKLAEFEITLLNVCS